MTLLVVVFGLLLFTSVWLAYLVRYFQVLRLAQPQRISRVVRLTPHIRFSRHTRFAPDSQVLIRAFGSLTIGGSILRGRLAHYRRFNFVVRLAPLRAVLSYMRLTPTERYLLVPRFALPLRYSPRLTAHLLFTEHFSTTVRYAYGTLTDNGSLIHCETINFCG